MTTANTSTISYFPFTAALQRAGKADITPLLPYCATPTQAAQLLLPFVLKYKNSTNATADDSEPADSEPAQE